MWKLNEQAGASFPFLFGGTFIEDLQGTKADSFHIGISLPFRRDFH